MNSNSNKIIFTCCWLVFSSLFFTLAYTVLLPIISNELGLPYIKIQQMFFVNILLFGISQFVYGSISDSFGNKKVLLVGLVIACVGNLTCAFAMSFPSLLIGQCLVGIGSGAATVVPRAVLKDEVHPDLLIKSIAIMSIATTMAAGLAPVTGSLIEMLFGWRNLFVFLALLAIVSMIFTQKVIPSRSSKPSEGITIFKAIDDYLVLFKKPSFKHNTVLNCGGYAAIIMYLTTTPFIFQKTFGYQIISNGYVYLLCAVSYLAANLFFIRVSIVAFSKFIYAGVLCILLGAIFLIIGALAQHHFITELILAGILINFGSGLITPLTFKHILSTPDVTSNVSSAGISATRAIFGFLFAGVITIYSSSTLQALALSVGLISLAMVASFFFTAKVSMDIV